MAEGLLWPTGCCGTGSLKKKTLVSPDFAHGGRLQLLTRTGVARRRDDMAGRCTQERSDAKSRGKIKNKN